MESSSEETSIEVLRNAPYSVYSDIWEHGCEDSLRSSRTAARLEDGTVKNKYIKQQRKILCSTPIASSQHQYNIKAMLEKCFKPFQPLIINDTPSIATINQRSSNPSPISSCTPAPLPLMTSTPLQVGIAGKVAMVELDNISPILYLSGGPLGGKDATKDPPNEDSVENKNIQKRVSLSLKNLKHSKPKNEVIKDIRKKKKTQRRADNSIEKEKTGLIVEENKYQKGTGRGRKKKNLPGTSEGKKIESKAKKSGKNIKIKTKEKSEIKNGRDQEKERKRTKCKDVLRPIRKTKMQKFSVIVKNCTAGLHKKKREEECELDCDPNTKPERSELVVDHSDKKGLDSSTESSLMRLLMDYDEIGFQASVNLPEILGLDDSTTITEPGVPKSTIPTMPPPSSSVPRPHVSPHQYPPDPLTSCLPFPQPKRPLVAPSANHLPSYRHLDVSMDILAQLHALPK